MSRTDPGPETIFSPMFEDFDEKLRDEENRWFDYEHVPQRLMTPGFLRAERYERSSPSWYAAAVPGPRYVNFYYLTAPSVLQTDAYQRQAEFKSLRVRTGTRARVGVSLREVWSERTAMRASQRRLLLPTGPKTLLLYAMDGPAAQTREELQEPDLRLSCPGVIGYQRFARNDDVRFSRPREHRAPQWLDFYWLTSPEIVTSKSFESVSQLLDERGATDRAPVAWVGLYLQRPSPWELVADYD